MPARQQYDAIMTMFDTSQRATIEAMASFAHAVDRLESRVASWENKFATLVSAMPAEPQRDGLQQEEEDVSDSQSVTPRYSNPGIGEEGGEEESHHDARQQDDIQEQRRHEE